MSMKYPSLSFLINIGWKSILLDIRMAIRACLLGSFAWKKFHAFYWGNVYLCCWSRFLIWNKMMVPLFISTVRLCLFMGNWVHWCWEILITSDLLFPVILILVLVLCVCVCVCVCVCFFYLAGMELIFFFFDVVILFELKFSLLVFSVWLDLWLGIV